MADPPPPNTPSPSRPSPSPQDPTQTPPLAINTLVADHAPSVPSPLNPDAAMARGRNPKAAPSGREQREKKDSLKKRESAAAAAVKTPEPKSKSKGKKAPDPNVPQPMRFSIAEPKWTDYLPPKDPVFASHEPAPIFSPDGIELKKPVDHAENKKAYRYHHCVADPLFHHKQYYRRSEVAPFGPRMSVEDSDRNIHFSESLLLIANEKGWRTSRANIYAREGSQYYEVKIVKGIPPDTPAGLPDAGPQPHIRIGWARREAPLDGPVGFDGYSYAITDTRGDTIHRSRRGEFITPQSSTKAKAAKKKTTDSPSTSSIPTEPLRTNDIIGLLITLPPLTLHRKVVAGTYNPAVDLDSSDPDPTLPPPDVIRDRIPVPYRGNHYFEHWEYQATKPMTTYADRAPVNRATPHPNANEAAMRSLPGSSIKVFRNGKLVGTAFENLMAFLPPASAPAAGMQGVRLGLDDGELGYYPAISLFSGAVAEMNFGPEFWCPPEGLEMVASKGEDVQMGGLNADDDETAAAPDVMKARPISERYVEQIAEDVVWDVIDEASFFAQDGGYNYVPEKDGMIAGGVAAATSNLKDEPQVASAEPHRL